MKTVIFITAFFICASISAQSFRYDTVPNPDNNQRQLYKYEYPVSKQNNQANRQTSTPKQEKASGFDKSKLILGGALGLSFGSNCTIINIAPQIGCQFDQYFAAGGGLSYNYYGYKNWSINYLGLNLYGRITPVKYIALQIQPEIHRMWTANIGSRTVPCILVGAGGVIPIGARAGISMMLYYDLVQDNFSPYYDQLIYSVGYVLNF